MFRRIKYTWTTLKSINRVGWDEDGWEWADLPFAKTQQL